MGGQNPVRRTAADDNRLVALMERASFRATPSGNQPARERTTRPRRRWDLSASNRQRPLSPVGRTLSPDRRAGGHTPKEMIRAALQDAGASAVSWRRVQELGILLEIVLTGL